MGKSFLADEQPRLSLITSEVYKAVEENDMNRVVFQDPFTEVARKAKRLLMMVSFIALLISILKLEITGFLGLQAAKLTLGNELAQGVACVVVIYALAAFIFHAFIDYSAWRFEREKQLTKPYLDLIKIHENHIRTTGEQIKNAMSRLHNLNPEKDIQDQSYFNEVIQTAKGQLESINKQITSLVEESQPLLRHWEITVAKMDRLSWRLRARFTSLWLLDIILPISLAILAILKAHSGLALLLTKIMSS